MKTTHTHHIIPKHAGGTDDPSNLIELTVKEHAEAHHKLYKEYGRWQDMIAWKTLSGQIDKFEATQLKNRLSKLGNTHRLNKMHTNETKKKISKSLIGHKQTNFGGYKQSDEYVEKCRKRFLKDNPAKKPEVRAKLKEKALNRPKFPCPHCGKEVTSANLSRWHGDNCKSL